MGPPARQRLGPILDVPLNKKCFTLLQPPHSLPLLPPPPPPSPIVALSFSVEETRHGTTIKNYKKYLIGEQKKNIYFYLSMMGSMA